MTCPILAQSDCPNGTDYSPCSCARRFDGVVSVICEEIPLAEVQTIFERNPGFDLFDLLLYPPASDLIIPANLLGSNHRVTNNIRFYCPYATGDYQLRLDPYAFNSSKNSLLTITTYHCDLARLDFDFLSGFDQLDSIDIYYSSSVHLARWGTMPALPSLSSLGVVESSDLNSWTIFPSLTVGLDFIFLINDGITDLAMERILNWVLQSSKTTLTSLSVNDNSLTRIPPQVAAFPRLTLLSFDGQATPPGISSILAKDLNFSTPISYLSAISSGISYIENGTFGGTYSLYLY